MHLRGAGVAAARSIVATAIAAAFVASGCAQKPAGPAGPPSLSVAVGKVVRGDISTYATFDGQISPLRQSILSTAQSGTVARIDATEGDFVTAGQVLATLDTSQLEAQLRANQATVAQDVAKLGGSDVQAPVNAQQYASGVSTAQQNLVAAQNTVQSDRAEVANTKLAFDANRQLVTQGYVASTTYEQARSSYVAAVKTLQSAQQSVIANRSALQTALSNTRQREVDQSTIDQNRASLEAARADVQLLRAQIAQSSVVAPYDGQITERLLDPGAYAGASQPLLQLSEVRTVYVVANVPDVDLPFVAAGKAVTFTTSTLPGRTFRGTVYDVNTTPTAGTLSYRVRLKQPNPGLTLRGGMLVSVTALAQRHTNTTIVPRSAVATGSTGSSIFEIENGKAKAIPVKLGLQTNTQTEVLGSGIDGGMTIITTQPNGLQNGAPVTVASPAAAVK